MPEETQEKKYELVGRENLDQMRQRLLDSIPDIKKKLRYKTSTHRIKLVVDRDEIQENIETLEETIKQLQDPNSQLKKEERDKLANYFTLMTMLTLNKNAALSIDCQSIEEKVWVRDTETGEKKKGRRRITMADMLDEINERNETMSETLFGDPEAEEKEDQIGMIHSILGLLGSIHWYQRIIFDMLHDMGLQKECFRDKLGTHDPLKYVRRLTQSDTLEEQPKARAKKKDPAGIAFIKDEDLPEFPSGEAITDDEREEKKKARKGV